MQQQISSLSVMHFNVHFRMDLNLRLVSKQIRILMTYLQLRYFNTDTKLHMLHSEKSIKSLLLIKLLFQKIILQKSYRKRADFKVNAAADTNVSISPLACPRPESLDSYSTKAVFVCLSWQCVVPLANACCGTAWKTQIYQSCI